MVLKEVLTCINKKRCIKVDEISRELNIPKGFVEHAIQKLKNMEYIIPVTPLNKEASCAFCPLRSTCNMKTAETVKFYMITEKGKKLLNAPFE